MLNKTYISRLGGKTVIWLDHLREVRGGEADPTVVVCSEDVSREFFCAIFKDAIFNTFIT